MADSMDKKYSNVPNLRFSNVDDWKVIKLSEYADFLQGLTYHPENVKHSGTLVLRSSNIQNGKLDFNDCVYVDMVIPKRISTKKNDVLMCVRNGSKALVGKTAIIDDQNENHAWGAFMSVLRPKDNSTFLFHYLNSKYFTNQIKADLNTATVNQITFGMLNHCNISIPLNQIEKNKICDLLDKINLRIDTQNKIIRNLESLYKGIKEKIIKCTTNHKSIADFLEEVVAKTTVQDEFPVLSSTVKGLFLQTDYFRRNIASENNIGYKIVKKNQIIISPQNLWMGNMTFNDKFEHGIVSPSYKVYKIKEGYVADYIVSILTTKRAFYYFSQVSEQGASVVRRNLNIDAFEQLSFPVPPFERQQHFSKLIRSVKNKLECETNYLEKLLIQKKYLLENLFI